MRVVLPLGISFLLLAAPIKAIVNPLSVPNNPVGIHILDPSEVFEAAKLVNSAGGDWGYVTIPMRSDDRDRVKWTNFFTQTKNLHLVPVVRLATYIYGSVWAAPTAYDLVDFSNFLSDMPWPTQNRYIVLFNEPNHSQEWGGRVDPAAYARLLDTARTIFSARSSDFFLITAGLDMSAPTSSTSLDALKFYTLMTRSQPNWYQAIDGLGAHAYPNPNFSSSPQSSSRYGVTSFRYETRLLQSQGFAKKPIFITETGYLGNRTDFFTQSFAKAWKDPQIVTVTPFILFAGAGDFVKFSLLDLSRQPKNSYLELKNLKKTAGSPILSATSAAIVNLPSLPSSSAPPPATDFLARLYRFLWPPTPELTIKSIRIKVEVADTPQERTSGLSGRKFLPQDTGKLFIFPTSHIQTFWMKDMNFSLDFIWIDQNRVVNLPTSGPPPSQTKGVPATLSSGVPVDMVLEVNAGFIDQRRIQIGDPIVLNFP